ncbi:MAG: MDR family MFS transporter [Caulobacter sp.]|nr:MDR family MFS transporter [Caulobacter sp.]
MIVPATPTEPAPRPTTPLAARLTSLAVASALLMEFIDSTSLSTALPTLAKAFDADPVHLKLALTSYILALAVFVPISGWASERFGARRVFLAAMAVFLTGSVLCGFSTNLTQLVAFRILQGMGGAMMTPVARLIVVGSTPREQLIKAMGWFTMPALVGPLIGPPLAGLVLAVADWPWIFWLNVPVGLLGMAAVMKFVPDLSSTDPGRFDWSGFMLSAVAITGLVAVAETAGLDLVPLPAQLGLLLLATGCGLAYLHLARHKVRPILDLALLRYPTFRASVLGGSFVRLGIGATPFLMPLLLQVGLGWTPLQAGSVTLAGGLGVLCARPVAIVILRRIGFRASLILFVILSAALTAVPGLFSAGTPIPLIMVLLFLTGFCRSNQFIAANTIAYADIPNEKVAAASTLSAVTQQIGLALGVSFGGLMLGLTRGPGAEVTSETALRSDAFTLPFLAIGLITLMAVPVYLALDPKAGANLSGHGQSSSGDKP